MKDHPKPSSTESFEVALQQGLQDILQTRPDTSRSRSWLYTGTLLCEGINPLAMVNVGPRSVHVRAEGDFL